MAADVLLVTQFASAVLLLALAAWLLWLKPDGPAIRAFALFLALRGIGLLAKRFEEIAEAPRWIAAWAGFAQYPFLPLTPLLLAFLVTYAGVRRSNLWRMGLYAAAGAAVIAYAFDHCLVECGVAAQGPVTRGPLSLLANSMPLGMAVVATVLAWIARGRRDPADRSTTLVATAFALNAVLDGSIAFAGLFRFDGTLIAELFDASPWIYPSLLINAAAFPVGLAALSIHAAAEAQTAQDPRRAIGPLVAAGLAAGCGTALVYATEHLSGEQILFIVGLWRIMLPALAAYALVRHRLFGIDVRFDLAIRSGTIASAAAACFVVGSEVLGELLESAVGASNTVAAVVVAALIAIGLKPLGWIARRVARAFLPALPAEWAQRTDTRLNGLDIHMPDPVRLFERDGPVGAKEEALLAELHRLVEHRRSLRLVDNPPTG